MKKNNTKRTIAVLTGKRGGFGALITLMQAIQADPSLRLEIIVTDMHLSPMFGKTVREVEKWFANSHRVSLRQKGDGGPERVAALGRAVLGMTGVLKKIKPDILVTLGDRGEVLAAATAALELDIPVAHILGGDRAGNRDGIRIHAITKLAHLHFPSSRDSYERVLSLGEEPWRVFDFGSTYIDLVVQKKYTQNDIVREKYGLTQDERYALCIQHPTTLREKDSYKEARAVYGALKKKGLTFVIVWPCSDQGYRGVLTALGEHRDVPHFKIHKNIEAVDFWGLMEGASFMVGNSSSGLMETPYFGLPSITVGARQEGRIRDMNVITAPPRQKDILAAIDTALSPSFRKRLKNNFVFGKGNAGTRIAKILKDISLDDRLLRKKITF